MMSSDSTTDTPSKRCNSCGHIHPATTEYFYSKKGGKFGVAAICKSCEKIRQNRRTVSRETKSRYARTYRRNMTPEQRQRQRERDKIRRNRRLDKRREYSRRYYAENRERLNKASSLRNKANAEYIRVRTRAWLQRNPDKARLKNHNRRARKIAAGGSFTSTDVLLQHTAQKGKCWHCGKDVGETYHVDHLVPLARGGSNDARNIVISCPECNRSKGTKLVQEWKGRLF